MIRKRFERPSPWYSCRRPTMYHERSSTSRSWCSWWSPCLLASDLNLVTNDREGGWIIHRRNVVSIFSYLMVNRS